MPPKQHKGEGAQAPSLPGEVTEYAYLRHGKPMPEGWELANTLGTCHHGHHAVLIRRLKKG